MRRTADSLLVLADAPRTAGRRAEPDRRRGDAGCDRGRAGLPARPRRLGEHAAAGSATRPRPTSCTCSPSWSTTRSAYSPPSATVAHRIGAPARGRRARHRRRAAWASPTTRSPRSTRASAPAATVTADTARRMGLFVVSRLAQRHGITVSLSCNPATEPRRRSCCRPPLSVALPASCSSPRCCPQRSRSAARSRGAGRRSSTTDRAATAAVAAGPARTCHSAATSPTRTRRRSPVLERRSGAVGLVPAATPAPSPVPDAATRRGRDRRPAGRCPSRAQPGDAAAHHRRRTDVDAPAAQRRLRPRGPEAGRARRGRSPLGLEAEATRRSSGAALGLAQRRRHGETWTTVEIEAGWAVAETAVEALDRGASQRLGLPVRRPGTRLVPGGVTKPATAAPATPRRSAPGSPHTQPASLAARAAATTATDTTPLAGRRPLMSETTTAQPPTSRATTATSTGWSPGSSTRCPTPRTRSWCRPTAC